MKGSEMKPTVVVVGAGVGGLAATAALHAREVDVCVLEARDRTGGRLLSVPTSRGRRLDLGATWFWPNEKLINALVSDAGLAALTQHLDGDMMYQAGTVQRVPGNQLDVESGRLVNGMQSITDALAAACAPDSIRLGQRVDAIHGDNDEGSLTVLTETQVIDAAHVVLSVPPALAVRTIDFSGGLDHSVAGIAAETPVWMGATIKVVAVYERAFWRESGLAGAAFSHDGPMREIHDMSGPDGHPAALFGFCSIPPGATAPTEDDVRHQLEALFGPEGSNPTAVYVQDWRAEEHTSNGATLALQNYATYGHGEFQQPAMDGRLHWASTETSPIAPGHIEGALVAGARAAEAILSDLRSP